MVPRGNHYHVLTYARLSDTVFVVVRLCCWCHRFGRLLRFVQHHRGDVVTTLKRVVAGGLAGMLAKSVVAPVDRVKILFQVTNEKFSFKKVGYLPIYECVYYMRGHICLTERIRARADAAVVVYLVVLSLGNIPGSLALLTV